LLGAAGIAQASTLTSNQISAILSLLQSFGADQGTINSVSVTLGGSPAPQSSCLNLSSNLTPGLSGSDVTALQGYLINRGDLTGTNATGYYGYLTASAVGRLQISLGIASSPSEPAYGFVGPQTREAIACGATTPTSTIAQPPLNRPIQLTSVSRMSEYNDTNFGFSFWFPSAWSVSTTTIASASAFPGATVTNSLEVGNLNGSISIEELVLATSSIPLGYWIEGPPAFTWHAIYQTEETPQSTIGGLPIYPVSAPALYLGNGKLLVLWASKDPGFDPLPLARTIVPFNIKNDYSDSAVDKDSILQAESTAYENY
jgi:hypothetical protein